LLGIYELVCFNTLALFPRQEENMAMAVAGEPFQRRDAMPKRKESRGYAMLMLSG